MCGIVGMLQLNNSAPDMETLQRMISSIVHRGPDDSGTFVDGPLALGFRRLSIIDLACGHQPLSTQDGRFTISFNGEIYNYRSVRLELEELGHTFTTDSDTEVLLKAFAEWREGSLPRLNGMFSFAVWDSQQRELFMARDRLGKKPLHFLRTPTAILWASEIKSLLEHPDVSANLDNRRLASFLTYRYVPGAETLFRGIEVLQPACFAKITEAGQMSVPRRWWDYEFHKESPRGRSHSPVSDKRVLLSELKELLKDAVRLRMIADVPFGAFLSGGLDSSVILALMSQLHSEPIKTFSIGFDTGFSEAGQARFVAETFGADHHEIIVSSDDLIRAIPAALAARESPITEPSDVPIYLLSQLARKKVTVVLSGEGSDEIFGGYPKYAFEKSFGWMQRLPAGLLRAFAQRVPANRRRMQLALQAMAEENRFERYASWFGALAAKDRRELLSPEVQQDSVHRFSELAVLGRTDFSTAVEEMLYLDTRHWLPANLLLRGDRMTMGCSLELRCPFLDYRLVEFAARSIPLNQKVRGLKGKVILKHLAEELLPKEIVHRKKWGFKVPVSEWFRGPLRGVLQNVLFSEAAQKRGYFQMGALRRMVDDHVENRADNGKQLWILFQLELWHLMFVDRTLSASDSLLSREF